MRLIIFLLVCVVSVFISECSIEDRDDFVICGYANQKCPEGYKQTFIGGQCSRCVIVEATPCDLNVSGYVLVDGCPDYQCICDMPRNQSLCDWVLAECMVQAQKLPKEKVCLNIMYLEVQNKR